MQEVTIRLRFLRECLGSVRRKTRRDQTIYEMPRSPAQDGRVMFLPSWWRSLMQYASKVANLHQRLAGSVDWDPHVDGNPRRDWRRTVVSRSEDKRNRQRYALHEAFHPGAVIGVNAVLPDGISIEEFQRLLEIAGTYRGISPFKSDDDKYGTFEVVSIMPSASHRREQKTHVEPEPTPTSQNQ